MSCYHPMDAFGIPNPETGKMKIVFPKVGQKDPPQDHLESLGIQKLKIPCGNCLGCRLEYSRQWAVRCFFEAKQWIHNYFVTLTYDPEFVPLVPHYKVNEETGEVIEESMVMTLVPDHLKNFIKRLRRNFEYEYGHTGLRFFACGEYGPLNSRPHYHLILFNCPLDDLKKERCSDGYVYYRSPFIEKAWSCKTSEGDRRTFGYVSVTDFSFETAAYVARYMLKKHKGKDSKYYEENGLYPEFTRCSRRPGLAYQYFQDHKDQIYTYDQVVITNGRGTPLKCHPPKYYDRLFDIDNPEEMAIIKDKRKDVAERSMQKQLIVTDVPEQQYLLVKENNKKLSIKNLKRSL